VLRLYGVVDSHPTSFQLEDGVCSIMYVGSRPMRDVFGYSHILEYASQHSVVGTVEGCSICGCCTLMLKCQSNLQQLADFVANFSDTSRQWLDCSLPIFHPPLLHFAAVVRRRYGHTRPPRPPFYIHIEGIVLRKDMGVVWRPPCRPGDFGVYACSTLQPF